VASTEFIKFLLFGSFWSFLLVLSAIVDIGLGLVFYFSDALTIENSPLPVSAICFIVGAFYLALAVIVALVKKKKHKP